MSDFIRVFLFFFSLTYWRNWTPSPAPFVLFHPSASVHGSPKSLRNVGFGCRAVSRSHQSSLVTGQIIGLDGGIMHHKIGEHTSELQSLMRIAYSFFLLKK